MFPALLLMHPQIAKSLVTFRHRTLKNAINNAEKNNYKGAMYPWESDETGMETTPFFAYKNALRENHIVGDVAFAQWQYFCVTRDTSYLRQFAADIIRQTANFWISRVNYNSEKDRYEIHGLISVSESDKYINNETYTNAVAKVNLDLAIKVSDLLHLEKNPQWEKVRDKMFIPFNKEMEFHPLYENANAGEGASKFWSSVVNLLDYPLQMEMSDKVKQNDLNHAVKSLQVNGAGAMMGINFLAIIAAELGNDSLLNLTIDKTLKGYLKPPFNVLSETHKNKSVNFLTGAGSFLQQIIFGYTGLRITDEGIVEKYKPMLPKNVKKLILKNFTVNNKKCYIEVENNQLTKTIY
jgi:trehalose/maltose hydrolase-like predicted phosphorylase